MFLEIVVTIAKIHQTYTQSAIQIMVKLESKLQEIYYAHIVTMARTSVNRFLRFIGSKQPGYEVALLKNWKIN